MTYPEHEKLKGLDGRNEVIGDFIQWLLNERGMILCEWREGEIDIRVCPDLSCRNGQRMSVTGKDYGPCVRCNGRGSVEVELDARLVPNSVGLEDLLADYFKIDMTALEQEKRAMLDELRALNR
jgi:hypothetical protein